jgi:hypothetical protein
VINHDHGDGDHSKSVDQKQNLVLHFILQFSWRKFN